MTANIGSLDRMLRLLIGLGLIALVFVGPHTPWGWLGLVPIGSAVFRYCPAYQLLGIRTCRAA